MTASAPSSPAVHPMWIGLALLAAAGLGLVFYDGTAQMIAGWGQEEYSYAYMIPPIAAWLIWQRRDALRAARPAPSWWGVPLVALGLILALFGELSTLYTVIHYALIVTVFGLALTLAGPRGFKLLWAPLLYLAFMVPLPNFLYQGLSGWLQLLSSQLGVAFIRLFGYSVFLEGNVIDLGVYQLQVAEACNGLRYLFPLASFGYLCALLYRGPAWHKVILVVSTLPITLLVNSVRIGVIGILVNRAGIAMAEGFLHAFEGWIIFLAAVVLLFAVMWLLARLSGRRGGLADLLHTEMIWPRRSPPAAGPPSLTTRAGSARPPGPALAVCALLAVSATAMLALPGRAEVIPARPHGLVTFPLRLGDWQGHELALEQVYVDVLKFDDYLLADYRRPGAPEPVQLYVAYYGSQRKGASVHSPRSCIPGGGWEIARIDTASIPGAGPGGSDLPVNRVLIAKGANRQLVYYWFDQRGRRMTNEYHVKLMLFWDALMHNRTDGSLVRLVTAVPPGEDLAAAERRLDDFLRLAYPRLQPFLPS